MWINNLLKNTNQIFQQNITGQSRSLAIGLLFWASHLLDFDPCAPPYSMLHMQKKDGIIIILKIYLTRPQLVVMGLSIGSDSAKDLSFFRGLDILRRVQDCYGVKIRGSLQGFQNSAEGLLNLEVFRACPTYH